MSIEDDAVGGASQPVERYSTKESIGEGVAPFVKVEVGGNDRGGVFKAFGGKFVKVVLVRRAKGSESEVIDDEEWDLGQGVETAIKRICRSGSVQVSQQFGLCV